MSEILLVNPTKRKRKRKTKKRKTSKRRTARRKNPAPPGRKRTYRRKRNPTGGRLFSQRNLMDVATAGVTGASGAIALDVALAYLPIPANWKEGISGDITKAVGAIAIGGLARQFKLVKPSTARDMTVGALTVQFTGIGRKLLAQFAPGVALSAYMDSDYMDALGYAGSGWNPAYGEMGAYNVGTGYAIQAPGDTQPGTMGAYMQDDYAAAQMDGY